MQEKTYSLRHGCLEIFKKIRYNGNIIVRWVMFLAVKYEILLFDADNTLFDFSRAERAAISETMRAFGIMPTEALVCSYSEVNDRMWKMLERGEIEKNALRTERFRVFCEKHGFSLDVERMATTYTDRLSSMTFTISGMEEVCRALAAHCRLYIVTNGIRYVQERRFAASPFVPYFRDVFISEVIGCEKPDLRYFEAIASKIPDFSPEKALLIGDSLTSDMQGAIGAGIDACWFNPKGLPNSKALPITYTVTRPEEILPLVLT